MGLLREDDGGRHLCPVWMGYLLASPLRRLICRPEGMLRPYVAEGMTVLDAGCAMGFFSLPLARLAGESGRVICVDVQAGMIERLRERAERAGLLERIETRVCTAESLCLKGLEGRVDFALAFAVVHEASSAGAFLRETAAALRPGGRLFLAEPRVHVKRRDFEETVATAEACGLREMRRLRTVISRAAVMEKVAEKSEIRSSKS